jgi:2-haloacid dehalogenase
MLTSTVIFDAFGTLFNLDTALLNTIEHPKKSDILNYTREKQLSYTWLFSLMNTYESFSEVTYRALTDGLKKYNAPMSLLDDFASLYMKPVVFDDVKQCLSHLKKEGKQTGILSNGTREMLNSGIERNALSDNLDHVFSAEELQIFKPHKSVYGMVTDKLETEAFNITFVSSNQWDVAGAHHFGFNTFWVDRKGLFQESIIGDQRIHKVGSLHEII